MNNRLEMNSAKNMALLQHPSFLNLYSDVGLLGIYLGCDPSQTESSRSSRERSQETSRAAIGDPTVE